MEADFRVTKGTSVLLCGGEGSGKSTFLRALASVLFKCVRSEACDGVPGRAEVSDRNLAFHFGRGGVGASDFNRLLLNSAEAKAAHANHTPASAAVPRKFRLLLRCRNRHRPRQSKAC
mmetsp:Transcript_49810/g.117138  ORF Transcript_49810/g.117138 Transcript_49810/m.117138 type:complete len:118 (+) Transcript_49810:1565-1918(+)|eukprot:s1421_g7.t1